MNKKITAFIFSLFIMLSSAVNIIPSSAENLEITANTDTVYINGNIKPFEAYNINGNNYFKLRDLAYYLNDTENKFSVDWFADYGTINITTPASYTPVGGECKLIKGSYTVSVIPSSVKVLVNGETKDMKAYNINGNNYFKLRDVGSAIGFGVDWSESLKSIIVYTNENGKNVSVDNAYNLFAQEVVNLVNIERQNAGLSPLSLDSTLTAAANLRADECNTLFSHTRPDGSSCFTVLKEFDISYRTCAENIAIGQRTPEEVVNSWMNSEGHRKNILTPAFNKIGIGVSRAVGNMYSSGYSWVQLFTN